MAQPCPPDARFIFYGIDISGPVRKAPGDRFPESHLRKKLCRILLRSPVYSAAGLFPLFRDEPRLPETDQSGSADHIAEYQIQTEECGNHDEPYTVEYIVKTEQHDRRSRSLPVSGRIPRKGLSLRDKASERAGRCQHKQKNECELHRAQKFQYFSHIRYCHFPRQTAV